MESLLTRPLLIKIKIDWMLMPHKISAFLKDYQKQPPEKVIITQIYLNAFHIRFSAMYIYTKDIILFDSYKNYCTNWNTKLQIISHHKRRKMEKHYLVILKWSSKDKMYRQLSKMLTFWNIMSENIYFRLFMTTLCTFIINVAYTLKDFVGSKIF